MARIRRFLICLGVLAAATACGEDEPTASKPLVPATPALALAWVREAEDLEDPAEVDRRLNLYPLDKSAFKHAEETRVVLTWRMQRALGAGRLEAAGAAFNLLGLLFDSTGRTPRGRTLSRGLLRVGFVDAALSAARDRIEDPTLEPARAKEALEHAEAVVGEADAELRERIAGVRRWVEATRVDALEPLLARHEGPRVVVLADDFALGEAILPGVLGRWQRDLGPMGLRVSVVPILRGSVRVGIRRLPAQDAEAELDSIRNRLVARRVKVEQPATEDVRAALGLAPDRSALLVVDRGGAIVARLSGPTLDPRRLETVVQRVASR